MGCVIDIFLSVDKIYDATKLYPKKFYSSGFIPNF